MSDALNVATPSPGLDPPLMVVPPYWRNQLLSLSEIAQEYEGTLLERLPTVAPAIPPRQYATRLCEGTELRAARISRLLQFIFDLYEVMDQVRVPLDRFLDSLKADLERFREEAPGADLEPLLGFVKVSLALDETVGVAAKAWQLCREGPMVFCRSRILSDARPILRPTTASDVEAFVTTHELKLVYHPGGDLDESGEIHIQLHGSQLSQLLREIERAIEKDKALINVLKNADLTALSSRGD